VLPLRDWMVPNSKARPFMSIKPVGTRKSDAAAVEGGAVN
jgi:hypothetical protein